MGSLVHSVHSIEQYWSSMQQAGHHKAATGEKTAAVQHLLANKRILIVLDNLETVAQSEVVVDNIFQILGKSKVIITSRHRIEHEQTFTMNLSGLSLDDGVSFLKEYSRERGIAVIGQAKPSTLVDIHQITGGVFLSMILGLIRTLCDGWIKLWRGLVSGADRTSPGHTFASSGALSA